MTRFTHTPRTRPYALLCLLLCFCLLFSSCELFGGAAETSAVTTGAQNGGSATLSDIPPYTGYAYVTLNDNVPLFTEEDMTTVSFETYAPLDSLGRCGVCFANVGRDIMPTEERGDISSVRPTGWQSVTYDHVNGRYLYNRCHLIGFQLTAENANERNLITGTRYLNIEGMLPFENQIADYVKETGNHVLYRVTPVFTGNNLVADGVILEGYSVEDRGEEICFHVYCYNVQPGVSIDYATGLSCLAGGTLPTITTGANGGNASPDAEGDYVLNTSSHKFHYPSCSAVDSMSAHNREDYHGLRSALIEDGYQPCGMCDP